MSFDAVTIDDEWVSHHFRAPLTVSHRADGRGIGSPG